MYILYNGPQCLNYIGLFFTVLVLILSVPDFAYGSRPYGSLDKILSTFSGPELPGPDPVYDSWSLCGLDQILSMIPGPYVPVPDSDYGFGSFLVWTRFSFWFHFLVVWTKFCPWFQVLMVGTRFCLWFQILIWPGRDPGISSRLLRISNQICGLVKIFFMIPCPYINSLPGILSMAPVFEGISIRFYLSTEAPGFLRGKIINVHCTSFVCGPHQIVDPRSCCSRDQNMPMPIPMWPGLDSVFGSRSL